MFNDQLRLSEESDILCDVLLDIRVNGGEFKFRSLDDQLFEVLAAFVCDFLSLIAECDVIREAFSPFRDGEAEVEACGAGDGVFIVNETLNCLLFLISFA